MKKELLEYEEFLELWKIKACEAGEFDYITNNTHFFLLALQNYLEFFFIDHLNLTSVEDIEEFGFKDDLESAGRTVTKKEIVTTLIFVCANYTLQIDDALKKEAYNLALKIYESKSKDNKIIKNDVLAKYKGEYEGYGNQIQDRLSEWIIAERLTHIRLNFSFKKKELKYISKHLDKEIDSSIVIDLRLVHKEYEEILTKRIGKGRYNG